MIAWLLLLVLVPIAARALANKRVPQYRHTIFATGLGLVASPVSIGLYSTYFLGPYGIATGLAGLFLVLWHAAPGYYICTFLGVVPARSIVEGASHLVIEIANGIFWGVIYGMLGFVLDHRRFAREAL